MADDIFLRRLPHALALEQRLQLDGIVTSADLAVRAYGKLTAELREIAKSDAAMLPLETRLDLAIYAWTIVDNLHNFRQFAEVLPRRPEGDLSKLLADLEIATKLRNAMDHRPPNVANAAKRTDRVYPIYGFISFYSPMAEDGTWTVDQIPLGTMQHREHVFPPVEGGVVAIANDVSHVHLAAFDREFRISDFVDRVAQMIQRINDQTEPAALQAVEQAALEAGEDVEKVLAERAGGMRIRFGMKAATAEEMAAFANPRASTIAVGRDKDAD